MVARCIGVGADSLVSRHLYESIVRELDLIDIEDGDGGSHWVERLGRKLPVDTNALTLILAGIDQLVDFTLPCRLPENIRLIATGCRLGMGADWASVQNLAVPVPPSLSDTAAELFTQLEQQFGSASAGKVASALTFGPVSEAELQEVCVPDLSAEDVATSLRILGTLILTCHLRMKRTVFDLFNGAGNARCVALY